ncbi:MAG TPA: Fur family transcriptional regulator [Bacteroidales bacterium]|nr:Fur family transcriptional regulator [Bacteroidales bacterium]
MEISEIPKRLSEKGLKVTPQRVAVLEAIISLNNHPTAECIIAYIREKYPNISVATVYKVLDIMVGNKLIQKVKTEKDIMRYDANTGHHHHIYCLNSEMIDDYYDDELNKLLMEYFKKKSIPDFIIDDLKLHIIGKYTKDMK